MSTANNQIHTLRANMWRGLCQSGGSDKEYRVYTFTSLDVSGAVISQEAVSTWGPTGRMRASEGGMTYDRAHAKIKQKRRKYTQCTEFEVTLKPQAARAAASEICGMGVLTSGFDSAAASAVLTRYTEALEDTWLNSPAPGAVKLSQRCMVPAADAPLAASPASVVDF